MKYVFAASLVTGLFIACSSPENEQDTTSNTQDSSFSMPAMPEVDGEDPDVILSGFPLHWVEVEMTSEGMIYHEWCGTNAATLDFEQNEDHWEILTTYGQDGEYWHLIRMSANQLSAENQEMQEGVMVVEKITYPDEEIYEVSYFWNKTAGFCTFGDFFSKDTRFANADDKAEFKVVKEDCDL